MPRRVDDVTQIAVDLFALSENALRDAARLAILARVVTRGNLNDAHGRMLNYVSKRGGRGYGSPEVIDLAATLRAIINPPDPHNLVRPDFRRR